MKCPLESGEVAASATTSRLMSSEVVEFNREHSFIAGMFLFWNELMFFQTVV